MYTDKFLVKSSICWCSKQNIVDTLKTLHLHPAGRALSSDWYINSFIMVVCEKKKIVVIWTKKSE